MSEAFAAPQPIPAPHWRELVWPKEHGSWSLAFEPVALGLLAAPSWRGGALALAVVAGFFARRPLRTAWTDARAERRAAARRAVTGCGVIATSAVAAAVGLGGVAWLVWLVPTVVAGGVFLYFDLQKAGREQSAEVAGSLAFAWLPAAFGVLAGESPMTAAALGVVMIARALPTVLAVRATVRARKGQTGSPVLPVAAALVAAVAVVMLALNAVAPRTAAVAAVVLAVRAFGYLVFPRPALRASTIGMIEAVLGVAYVVTIAAAW